MYIPTPAMKSDFISGLHRTYARALLTKSIADPKDVLSAAVKLFDSGTPFRPQFSNEKQEFLKDSPLLKTTLTPLVDEFWKYFNKKSPFTSQHDFDMFHKELCNLFLHDFASYNYSYGNAQKFVNMLFKYLACFDDANIYAEWFKYCHMALDGYTYCGASRDSYPFSFYRDVVYPAIHGYPAEKLTPWSKLSETEYTDVISDIVTYMSGHSKTHNTYLAIYLSLSSLTSITPISPSYELTPFMAEFFLWSIAKACSKKFKKYSAAAATVASIVGLL